MRFFKIMLGALCGLALIANAALAQVPDPFARQLAEQLARIDRLVGEDGFTQVAGPFSAASTAGAGETFTVTLRAGREYFVAAVCDSRCGGVRLHVGDPNGGTIAGGASARVRPSVTGPYAIEAEVARCAADACWLALNIYAR